MEMEVDTMVGFFIALLSGALMSIQGVFNTQVTKTTGMWVSNAWVQLTAFAVCFLLWLFNGRDSIATIAKVEPKYMPVSYTHLMYQNMLSMYKIYGLLDE